MNLKKSSSVITGFSILFILIFSSCKKNGNVSSTDPTEAAQNNALAEAQYNDVTTMVDQSARNSNATFGAYGTGSTSGVLGILGSTCATLSVDTSSNPRTITIDFGNSNCLCLDDRYRRGKILATYTGSYRNTGTVVQISFDNYYVNDNKIGGTKTITNQGPNQSGNLVYKIEVNGEIVKANNGGTVTWISTRYREWKEGYNTPLNILDDVYGITGEAHGTNANGDPYTINIDQELIRKMNCRWFESGKLTLNQNTLTAISLDYGQGGCDANATVTFLGKTYPVILP